MSSNTRKTKIEPAELEIPGIGNTNNSLILLEQPLPKRLLSMDDTSQHQGTEPIDSDLFPKLQNIVSTVNLSCQLKL